MMIVAVSGGFDPIHVGHIRLIEAAAKLGEVVVILNNDNFLKMKKGYIFMPSAERKEILENIKGVKEVIVAVDDDMSVNKTLRIVHPDIFANGGDVQNVEQTREYATCKELGIELLYGVGGDKIQSSSRLVNNLRVMGVIND